MNMRLSFLEKKRHPSPTEVLLSQTSVCHINPLPARAPGCFLRNLCSGLHAHSQLAATPVFCFIFCRTRRPGVQCLFV